jgi:hypothetical protein
MIIKKIMELNHNEIRMEEGDENPNNHSKSEKHQRIS